MIRRTFVCYLAILFSLSSAGCNLLKPGPAKTVQVFYEHVERGEIQDAINCLSSEVTSSFGADKVRTMLIAETDKIKRKGGIDSFEVKKEEITGEIADVSIVFKYKDGSTESQNARLIKENDEWRIDVKK